MSLGRVNVDTTKEHKVSFMLGRIPKGLTGKKFSSIWKTRNYSGSRNQSVTVAAFNRIRIKET